MVSKITSSLFIMCSVNLFCFVYPAENLAVSFYNVGQIYLDIVITKDIVLFTLKSIVVTFITLVICVWVVIY